MKLFLGLVLLTTNCVAAIESVPACDSAKEFVTIHEFIKSKNNLYGNAAEMVKLSSLASQGCSGSAKRFIKVTSTLEKTDLTAKDILQSAQQLAQKSDQVATAFVEIFKRGYATDGFDLDLQSSLQLAKSLSVDFIGDVEMAMQDFTQISDFCLSKKGMDYSKPQCGKMAQRMALYSDKHGLSVAQPFLNSIQYLSSKSGPEIPMGEAIKLAEEIVKNHPSGGQDFKTAYQYAVSKKGLDLKREEAINFAKKMALQTVKENASESKK